MEMIHPSKQKIVHEQEGDSGDEMMVDQVGN